MRNLDRVHSRAETRAASGLRLLLLSLVLAALWSCGAGSAGDTAGTRCGNGIRDLGEQCDGADVGHAVCPLPIGTEQPPACNTDCTLDVSACPGPWQCGNGRIDRGIVGLFSNEDCDGDDLGDATCERFGLNGGPLRCDASCRFDLSSCEGAAVCGNGRIDGLTRPFTLCEICDGPDRGGKDCTFSGFYSTGSLGCSPTCGLDFAGCQDLATCGNGAIDPGEDCDGTNLGGKTCDTLPGFRDGRLVCTRGCRLDTSSCIAATCGNGRVDPDEVCDGTDLGGRTCSNFDGGCAPPDAECGVPTCTPDCREISWARCSPKPPTCGNGVIDGFEECDGADLNGQSCETIGYFGGSVSCAPNCQLDSTRCVSPPPTCGNGLVEGAEDCEDENLNGQTCESLGFPGGELSCGNGIDATGVPVGTNCRFNTLDCVSTTCGNNRVDDPREACDGTDLEGLSCLLLGLPFGELRCNSDCREFDTNPCRLAVGICGDSAIDAGEDCDGENLNGLSCQAFGFLDGTLTCRSNCRLDTGGCRSLPSCGNDVLDADEECEGENLNGQTCESLGFPGGGLACGFPPFFGIGPICRFNTFGCTSVSCGNNRIDDPREICDGVDLSGRTCASVVLKRGGTLRCRRDCRSLDTSDCGAPCGNFAIDPGEDCDGEDLNGETCASLGFPGGSLACLACEFDTSGCTPVSCGDGRLDPGEECDGAVPAGLGCLAVGYHAGELGCRPDCKLDRSRCSLKPMNCGNGRIEPDEQCDGAEIGGVACERFGPDSRGSVVCDENCQLDFRYCLVPCDAVVRTVP